MQREKPEGSGTIESPSGLTQTSLAVSSYLPSSSAISAANHPIRHDDHQYLQYQPFVFISTLVPVHYAYPAQSDQAVSPKPPRQLQHPTEPFDALKSRCDG